MDNVIRISRPEDVVAYVPYALGFQPRDSAVFVGMRAGGPGLGLTTRVDLEGLGHPAAGPGLVDEIAGFLTRDACDDAFVVLYTDEPRDLLAQHPVVRPALDLLRSLTSWADRPGPWVVGDRTYGCWGDEETCAPGVGDVAELEQGWLAATMVLHGQSVVGERTALHVPRATNPTRRRVAVRAAHHVRRELLAAEASAMLETATTGASSPSPRGPNALEDWRTKQWLGWRLLVADARAGRELRPWALGSLAVALQDPRIRDAVLYSLVRGTPRSLPSAQLAVDSLDAILTPGGPAPVRDTIGPAETVLRATVACVGAEAASHALAVLAWAAWWSGDGARADVLSCQALDARPGTRLAALVQQAVQACLVPGWAARTTADDVDRRSFR